ncbi:MAG TPA: hypothetical protein VFZ61_03865 [Polyangiales bacterium]
MEGNGLAPTTPTEQPKKRRGPLSITERLASVREAGKAKLAKLEAKRDAKAAEVRALGEQIDALRAEIGIHEDDEAPPQQGDDDAHDTAHA